MATKRLLDVWVVELNSVYKDVPFTVVTDWLQQGRLLGEDRVRPAGSEKWFAVGRVPALAAFLPQEQPFRAEDHAEALEPVETGFSWRRRGGEDDEDVDMIPLIDISLVLLIFFMMTAAVSSGVISKVKTPQASHQVTEINQGMFWLGIDTKDQEGQVVKDAAGQPAPWYSLGHDHETLHAPARDLASVRTVLHERLAGLEGDVKVRIRADESLPIEIIRGATLEVQRLAAELAATGTKINLQILGEVSDPTAK